MTRVRRSRFITILAANNLVMNGLMILGGAIELIRLAIRGTWDRHFDVWPAMLLGAPLVIFSAVSSWTALRRSRRARLLNLLSGLAWIALFGSLFVLACFSHDRYSGFVRVISAFYFGYSVLCTLMICSPVYRGEFETDTNAER